MGEYACTRRDSSQHGASDRCQLANDPDEAFGRFVQEFVSDTCRYVTGSTVLVDAGFTNK
jgi:hypothetical protein